MEYYYCSPLFVRAHEKSTITISHIYHGMDFKGDYDIRVVPYLTYKHEALERKRELPFQVTAEDGCLNFEFFFEEEQMYEITVFVTRENERWAILETAVYALEDDLYYRIPLKGDLHTHSTCSDGIDPPEVLVCAARSKGLQFLAVTDHNEYEGSIQAEKAAKALNCSITVIHGEEFACCFTPMHILSLGAGKPVDSRFYSRGVEESDEVKQLLEDIPDDVKSNPVSYACIQNLFSEIKRNGGLCIICHPFWKFLARDGRRKDVPLECLMDLIHHKNFDGIEIVSGSPKGESYISNLQDLLAREAGLPYGDLIVTGVTDSHNFLTNEIAGRHYTIVFSDGISESAIMEAIRNGMLVAVEHIDEEDAHCYGSFRLCCFARFLIKYYFPEKDKEAFTEGYQLLRHLRK